MRGDVEGEAVVLVVPVHTVETQDDTGLGVREVEDKTPSVWEWSLKQEWGALSWGARLGYTILAAGGDDSKNEESIDAAEFISLFYVLSSVHQR